MPVVDLAKRFRALLSATQAERHLRPDLVTVNGQPECEWASYERKVMHREVNLAREAAGFPPVPLEAVARVEQQAVGHVDYTAKFALYCAELATREQP